MSDHIMHLCKGEGADDFLAALKKVHGWPYDEIPINKRRKGRTACPYCEAPLENNPDMHQVTQADVQLLNVNPNASGYRRGPAATKDDTSKLIQENKKLAGLLERALSALENKGGKA